MILVSLCYNDRILLKFNTANAKIRINTFHLPEKAKSVSNQVFILAGCNEKEGIGSSTQMPVVVEITSKTI